MISFISRGLTLLYYHSSHSQWRPHRRLTDHRWGLQFSQIRIWKSLRWPGGRRKSLPPHTSRMHFSASRSITVDFSDAFWPNFLFTWEDRSLLTSRLPDTDPSPSDDDTNRWLPSPFQYQYKPIRYLTDCYSDSISIRYSRKLFPINI